jgi:hypothetical protein
MSARAKGVIVLAVQLVLVLSVVAKFAWERHSCPMVWTRTYQYDPSLPLRGRYVALTLTANACDMPKGALETRVPFREWMQPSAQSSRVHTVARKGQLALQPAPEDDSRNAQQAVLGRGIPCEAARLQEPIDFFISDKAVVPPLKKGEEMWALVTVPPSGPPRPVELAISDGKSFHVLDLR